MSQSKPTKKHIGLRVRMEYDPLPDLREPRVLVGRLMRLGDGAAILSADSDFGVRHLLHDYCRILEVLPD